MKKTATRLGPAPRHKSKKIVARLFCVQGMRLFFFASVFIYCALGASCTVANKVDCGYSGINQQQVYYLSMFFCSHIRE